VLVERAVESLKTRTLCSDCCQVRHETSSPGGTREQHRNTRDDSHQTWSVDSAGVLHRFL